MLLLHLVYLFLLIIKLRNYLAFHILDELQKNKKQNERIYIYFSIILRFFFIVSILSL